mmetsp:Transcript_28214/g.28502  ORF Transcript_28214/g.28502 Transcript_28214/m.28502 type:complete len:88 (-) Transcript_28214:259-522(-)
MVESKGNSFRLAKQPIGSRSIFPNARIIAILIAYIIAIVIPTQIAPQQIIIVSPTAVPAAHPVKHLLHLLSNFGDGVGGGLFSSTDP